MTPQAPTHNLPVGTHVPSTQPALSPTEPTPFICRRPVRLTIYMVLGVFLVVMLAWGIVPKYQDPTFQKHIESKRVIVGMTRQQVLQAWGSPNTMNVTHTKDGLRREEWIFEDWESSAIIKHRYLYFEEGTLLGGWYQGPGERLSATVPKKGAQSQGGAESRTSR